MIKESTLRGTTFLGYNHLGVGGGGIPSLKSLSSISNTNQIRVLLVLLVPEVTYPHHFCKLIVSCVTLVK